MKTMTLPDAKTLYKELPPVSHLQVIWKHPAVPRHAVQALIVDSTGLLLLMHRSNKVRSARNVWSIPTGMHDLGERSAEAITREVYEEYGLTSLRLQVLDVYDNIAGDDDSPVEDGQYHWILTLYIMEVASVAEAVNKEPDKHDQMLITNYHILEDDNFLEDFKFHTSLQSELAVKRQHYCDNIKNFINPFDYPEAAQSIVKISCPSE